MAASSSTSPLSPSLANGVPEKLTRGNFLLWKAQILPPIRGAQLMGYLDGTAKEPKKTIIVADKDGKELIVPNPDFTDWMARDQAVLGFLSNSLSLEVLGQVASHISAAPMWAAIEAMFAAQSRSRILQLRFALSNTKKGNRTAAAYFAKMVHLGDEMAAAGKVLEQDEMVSYILAGLDMEYNSLVAAMAARVEPMMLSELYSQLLSFETRLNLLQDEDSTGFNASANAANRGGRGGFGRGGRGDDRGRGNYFNNNRGRDNYFNNNQGRQGGGNDGGNGGNKPQVQCQLCKKLGHEVLRCWKNFDATYTGENERSAGMVTNSYGVDTNWYTDTGATDHITGELEKLTTRDKYNGHDQVHTASGSGSGHEENSSSR